MSSLKVNYRFVLLPPVINPLQLLSLLVLHYNFLYTVLTKQSCLGISMYCPTPFSYHPVLAIRSHCLGNSVTIIRSYNYPDSDISTSSDPVRDVRFLCVNEKKEGCLGGQNVKLGPCNATRALVG